MLLAGLLIVAAADVFEAVASLDLGQAYGVKVLVAASLLALAATALGILAGLERLPGWAGGAASLSAYALLAAGYHAARRAAARPQAQPGGQQ